jgi:uncharacterized membrane protein YkvA (DUF1232 family)
MKNEYNPVLIGILIAVAVFLYMAGPIDFVPDFISGLGQIDDGIVLTLGMIAEIINIFLGIRLSYTGEYEETYDDSYSETSYGEYREV